jgi:phosphatidylserine decarboxylase
LLAVASYGYSRLLGLIFFLFAGFTLYFFRDPERCIPSGANLVLSPADGRVTKIEELEHSFIGGRGKVVSIFLSPFDVHINRSPISGTVGFMEYARGSKHPAYLKRASAENESNLIGIDGGDIKVLVKQIAGSFARRIVTWVSEGDAIERGGKLGMIRFGSRTEVFVPDSVSLKVSVGEKVKAGESIVGEVRDD